MGLALLCGPQAWARAETAVLAVQAHDAQGVCSDLDHTLALALVERGIAAEPYVSDEHQVTRVFLSRTLDHWVLVVEVAGSASQTLVREWPAAPSADCKRGAQTAALVVERFLTELQWQPLGRPANSSRSAPVDDAGDSTSLLARAAPGQHPLSLAVGLGVRVGVDQDSVGMGVRAGATWHAALGDLGLEAWWFSLGEKPDQLDPQTVFSVRAAALVLSAGRCWRAGLRLCGHLGAGVDYTWISPGAVLYPNAKTQPMAAARLDLGYRLGGTQIALDVQAWQKFSGVGFWRIGLGGFLYEAPLTTVLFGLRVDHSFL